MFYVIINVFNKSRDLKIPVSSCCAACPFGKFEVTCFDVDAKLFPTDTAFFVVVGGHTQMYFIEKSGHFPFVWLLRLHISPF